MMKIEAEVITCEEATYPKHLGLFVVTMNSKINNEYTGQSWAIFQGSKKECEALASNMNEGVTFLENNK